MKNEEWLTPLVFLTFLLFISGGNAPDTGAAMRNALNKTDLTYMEESVWGLFSMI